MGTQHSKVNRENFRKEIGGKTVDLYCLRNASGMELSITNYGAKIVELFAPDRDGNFADVVLGCESVDDYATPEARFFGTAIGRYGNRIAGAKFELGGKTYRLPVNNGPNSLHGGLKGFDKAVWDVFQPDVQTLEFSLFSKDGEEGYPGNIRVFMTYRLTDSNGVVITYRASTDTPTHLNLTNHSFFNLHGAGVGDINDHFLTINADKYTPTDSVQIPTGEIADVANTPMDFRKPTQIGARVNDAFEQLKLGCGYDHNWVLNRKTEGESEFAAAAYDPQSGRYLDVYTTEPAIQFYGGNYLNGKSPSKGGAVYKKRAAFCLETQHFPDSPNKPKFPSTLLTPDKTYFQVCEYRFSVR